MPAHFFPVGEPAHDAERQALRYLVEGLDESFAVYGNPWIVSRGGAGVFEVDAVVVARHCIFVVEMKAYRGRVLGNDYDWHVPEPIRSPLGLNRKTAQILQSEMRRKSYDAGKPWVDFLVFLSHTNDVSLQGPVSEKHVHTRKTILGVLRGNVATTRDPHRPEVDEHAAQVLHELLTGADRSRQPRRRLREYELLSISDRSERYVEYKARHAVTRELTGLRVYSVDPLATEPEREKLLERFRWEAQVLGRVSSHPNILRAGSPVADDEGLHLALPFDLFHGVTVPTWLSRYRRALRGNESIAALVAVWEQAVAGIRYAHRQGVVHRLLRPEVVLVEDRVQAPEVRLTGFELAKQLKNQATVHVSSLGDERMRYAAPEVLANFSDAGHAADQFGLGVLLAWLLTGSAPFESTHDFLRRKGICPRLRDKNPFVAQSLDDAVQKMLSLRAVDRFPDLEHALARVRVSLGGAESGQLSLSGTGRLDPERLEGGTRLGADYEVRSKLGEGGLGTVYLARHLVSGTYRALKVARPNADAEDALRAEARVLAHLHAKGEAPGIVRAIDLRGDLVPGRFTLVMERAEGAPLSRWLLEHPEPSPAQLRSYAQDLLSALVFLETAELDERPVVHKDLKPDNLVVGERGLTVIDFSLAGTDEPAAGTSLYKDPAQLGWSRASDRYAAALCLHELYTGYHPFGGNAPAPGEAPDLDPSEFDAPGLVDFFRKALDPTPERRHPSAAAMRADFLEKLGLRGATPSPPPEAPPRDEAHVPLAATVLHSTAVAVLRRSGVVTQGQLVGLSDAQIRGISSLGHKKARQVLALRQALIEAGVEPPPTALREAPLREDLLGDPTELVSAGFSRALAKKLEAAGLLDVGRVAATTAEALKQIEGIGPSSVREVVEALSAFAERGARTEAAPGTPDALWSLATRPLTEDQREVLQALYGFDGEPRSQAQVAERTSLDPPKVSRLHGEALERLDERALGDALSALELHLDAVGGLAAMPEAVEALLRSLPTTRELIETDPEALDPLTLRTAEGLVRLLVRTHEARLRRLAGLEDHLEIIHRPTLDPKDIEAFVARARELAGSWPPADPEHVRKQLGRALPGFDPNRWNPLGLAERLLGDVRLTDAGELYQTPVEPKDAITYLLRRYRAGADGMRTLADLRQAADRAFGPFTLLPEDGVLADLVARLSLGVRVEGELLVPEGSRGERARKRADPLPDDYRQPDKSPADVAVEQLAGALDRRGWRLVVAPPERAPEVGRALAARLDATYVSFASELFAHLEPSFDAYEEASRFAAQKRLLTKQAEKVLDALLQKHGAPGARVVVGDTAVLATCEALHLVRRLYDRTHTGTRGGWALVVPGVLHKQQPWFLEAEPVFQIPGQVVPLPDLPTVAEPD